METSGKIIRAFQITKNHQFEFEILRRLRDVHGIDSTLLVTIFAVTSDEENRKDVPANIQSYSRNLQVDAGRWDETKGLSAVSIYR